MKTVIILVLVLLQYNLKSQDTIVTNCMVNFRDSIEIKKTINYEIHVNKRYVYFKSTNKKLDFNVRLSDTLNIENNFYNDIYTIECDLPNCTFKIEKRKNKITMVAIKNEINDYYVFYLNCI